MKSTWHPSCSRQTFKPTSRPPNSHFASLLKACCLQKSAKNNDFPLVVLRFLASQLLATLHPRSKPSKPKICLKMPSWTPREGPRRAQDGPRWAQDGPKKVRHTTTKSCKIIPGALLGPSWATSGLQQTMVFTMVFATFQFSNPSDLKLLPTCKLPEPSLLDLKLKLAFLIHV